MNLSKNSLRMLQAGTGLLVLWSVMTMPFIIENCSNSKIMTMATILSMLAGTAIGISIIVMKNRRWAYVSKQVKEAAYKFGITAMIWCAVYTLVVAFHAVNDVAMPAYSAFCLMQGLFMGLLGAAYSLNENNENKNEHQHERGSKIMQLVHN